MMKAIVLAVLLLTMLGGCKYHAPNSDVDKASGQFFLWLRDGRFDRIYEEAAQPFKDQQSRANILDNLQQIADYGRPVKWRRLSMRFGDEDKVHVALPLYIVQTDKMDEEINLKFGDFNGVWRLLAFEATPHGPRN